MSAPHANRQVPARGSLAGNATYPSNMPRLSVGFDRALWDAIAGEAARRKMPAGALVRELCVLALRQRADGGGES